MNELRKLSITEMHDGLRRRNFSAVELVETHINAVENEQLNAFITKTPEIAIKAAKIADEHFLKQKDDIPPLMGIPVGVKDLFCTKGIKTTACSKMLENFIPTYESTVSNLLLKSGAAVLGKLNMDEFAMGSANTNSYFGPVENVWIRKSDGAKVVPGGSSGGSAASVAGFLCAGALGSDTGGSVRQPAAYCGVVGIKPTYGRCSRFGMIAFASSLDQAGVITRSVSDSALMLETICGYDEKDSTSSERPVPKFSNLINGDIKGKRIGIPKEYRMDGISEEIVHHWEKVSSNLKENGAEVVDIALPHTKYAIPVYYLICSAETSSNLARYDGVRYGFRVDADTLEEMYSLTRAEGFGKEVKRRILIGAYALSSGHYNEYYEKAQCIRALIRNDFTKAFEKIDYILVPSAPTEAFGLNEKPDPLIMCINDVFTVPASLSGLPAISVPVGLSNEGLPLALQVIGNYYDEAGILNMASVIEQNCGRIVNSLA
ncbi:Asp-tRNA(Asn)/Glu-tRNA(Gln) amidotransferase subunit GatA [Wolbachia endosymbiont of Diaphorina citri]|jgi:aspartyl/glutamyl-tRNA(Asn/Gln) amidotransferase, A subunit|uniref:Asp-tRNA(Asn)/Glu-tRNA(Gln) amidotransferase subunit GatA n=1 Tax=Wolbachia endosymbiont of Diaphorina citri TaxID=116598 RepID=UPI00031227D6|nr:Asp-tRNA(Asn)/Glu-tRNA(Gln) amidotransferase subunit GatA [Wolbachia endosymbiont of Diaphorina citri]QJT94202.1 Asp-tRNA(Asn)/Glu-tRNA(Gln) amidotransferase subunit GatA [Wolbachia endosymbiont of Diaphorina citri]QJT95443.1 Asp-tRNA(Asn)/Glu-tRNA(Gln) amidotransferase subunit GatA [Wolbachia endosymbiont of Diaphorina citri]QJT96804.1 Asp-tRNA(Asn)/Glu-tRNA(Gln) amidotransferase subunit GatA [Wolbachia endosymbiont of Diaphorina citri]QLK11099.1 Asp-tRNA(Asn)/Glu-tRNA(Gln) amidotransferase